MGFHLGIFSICGYLLIIVIELKKLRKHPFVLNNDVFIFFIYWAISHITLITVVGNFSCVYETRHFKGGTDGETVEAD